MATLLHIQASPRVSRSHSAEVARAFIDAYHRAHPKDVVETLDLWAHPLQEFNNASIDAKYAIMHGHEFTPEQAAAWARIKKEFDHFAAADKLVLSLPMWNFGIPYKLKHFIDVITQPSLAFNLTSEGRYVGLVTGKPAVVVYARGGEYAEGAPYDMQRPYVELWLHFIGFTDIRTLLVEPTLGAPEKIDASRSEALEKARALAAAL